MSRNDSTTDAAQPNPRTTTASSGFLQRLESREELSQLCTVLTFAALETHRRASEHEQRGEWETAARLRRSAQVAAREGMRLLWLCRRLAGNESDNEE